MKSWQSLIMAGLMCFGTLIVPGEAEAGPLLDWLRGNRQRCRLFQRNTNPGCSTCQTGIAAPALAQANPYNLQPGQCATTCNQTCSRTVVNYVPYTAYRCSWEQVPVTQYKPVTSSDPCTGCSVTCMKPCTSYTWQMKQVPYTTYRAEYRTENYTVPVTTISNPGECATCGVPGAMPSTGCATCNVPGSTMPGTSLPPASGAPVLNPPPGAPIYGTPQPSGGYPYPAPGNVVPSTGTTFAPSGTLNTGGSFGSSAIPTPADTVPALNVNPQTMQRPILDSLRGANDNGVISPERNAVLPGGVTLEPVNHRSALRRDWGYTPVRLASHSEPVRSSDSEPYSRVTEGIFSATSDVVLGQSESVPAAPATKDPNVNSHWRNAGW